MKKMVLFLLALILALPALSLAGSATSRWDLTIGGYVKFDMGYASQGVGQDYATAQRQGYGAYDNATDKYGNFYSYAGETRLNFLTRGPDAWGAKTSAFIEGDFRGLSNSAAGTFTLRHAFMAFDWARSKLIIGQTYQRWGLLPTYSNTILGYNDIAPFLKGQRQPMIRFEQWIPNSFNWSFAVMSPSNTLGNTFSTSTGTVDGYTQSGMPFYEGSIGWSSDKCGNIGSWKMLFNLEGFYGQQKQTTAIYNGATAAASTALTYADKNVDSWGISFKGFVPIIPEKKGNKQGALSVSGILFYTQNPNWLQGSYAVGSYNTTNYGSTGGTVFNNGSAPDFASPKTYGGWGQASYFFTDKLYISGWYGYLRNDASTGYNRANPNVLQNTSQYIVNLSYDVNAAVRFGAEYAYMVSRYAGYTTSGAAIVGDNNGTLQSFRVGAWYFF